jgi:hypothetical protein
MRTNAMLLLAGLEPAPLQDPGLTTANAIPTSKFLPGYNFAELRRLIVNQGIDAAKKLIGAETIDFNYECELIASGVVGVEPYWGPLLEACGFTKSVLAAAAIDDPIAAFGNTGLSGLAVLSEGSFTGTVPRVYKVAVTTGGASGVAEVSVTCQGDDTQNSVNNVVTTATPIVLGDEGASITFTFASGSLTEGDAWYVYCYPPGIRYKPTAYNGTFGSLFFYHYLDELLFKAGGGRGNVTINAPAGEIASFQFNFKSVFASVEASAVPAHAFSDDIPEIVESANFQIDGFSGLAIDTIGLETNNNIVEKKNVNYPQGLECYKITGRDNQFRINPEALPEDEFAFWAKLRARTEFPMGFQVGSTPGNIVHVQARRSVFDNLTPEDREDTLIYGITGQCRPSPAGNDNMEIFVC